MNKKTDKVPKLRFPGFRGGKRSQDQDPGSFVVEGRDGVDEIDAVHGRVPF